MQTRITFRSLRRGIETGLICPPARDAIECLARFVPTGTGPMAEYLGTILFVDDAIWRFRSAPETRRFAEQMESYFRNFDSEYGIRSLDASDTSENRVTVL
jgi:hypothetical protein